MVIKMNELVSIIIPVYNVENYLQRCVDAVLQQTYRELEIILVNDGSTDRSGDICDYYAKEDARIKVIHQANAGQSVARNAALKAVNGKYICFIDSDDYVSLNYIETLYRWLTGSDADISICEYVKFTGELADAADIPAESKERVQYNNVQLIKNMHTVADELYVVMWGKLFKRELLEGIRFPEGRICEDLAVLYRIFDRAERAVYVNKTMYYYFRNNTGSSTFKINDKFYQDVYLALEEEIAYLQRTHKELADYPRKTYMYWLLDYYRKLKIAHHGSKEQLKRLHNRYRKLYREGRGLSKERFYTFFYYCPGLYLKWKNNQ